MIIKADMKDALRQRPGAPERPYSVDVIHAVPSGRKPRVLMPGDEGTYTVTALWTPAEIRTLRHLLDRVMSDRITERAEGQVWLRRFKDRHGDEIYEMMLAEIRRQDASEWFKAKARQGIMRGA